MSLWSKEECRAYVEANADRVQRANLHGLGTAFDERYDMIVVGFDTMWDWMHYGDIVNLDASNFRYLREAYRHAMEDYRRRVNSRLYQIKGRRSGLALLDEIAATGRKVRITPYHGKKPNAEVPLRVLSGLHGTARGKPIDYDDPELGVGDGAGTDASVLFSPDTWIGPIMAGPANAPDEVLYHELVHASRVMRGVMDAVPVDSDYDDEEEYLAIVLANIYISEKGQRVFAGDHGDGILQGLQADFFLRNSQHVSMPPTTLIENFRWSQPRFYQSLVQLPNPPKYNWVRDYNRHQQNQFIM